MAESGAGKSQVLEAVASQLEATCDLWRGANPGAWLELNGRRIAAQVVPISKKIVTRDGLGHPRLRFDRVALRLVRDLHIALRESVPRHATLVITVTAPIRKSSRTVVSLVDEIGRMLARKRARVDMRESIEGNRIEARLVNDLSGRASRAIAFVHNPDSDPEVLFGVTAVVLQAIAFAAARDVPKRMAAARWLVMADETGLAQPATYRHVCAQLAPVSGFERILLVLADGHIETLTGRDQPRRRRRNSAGEHPSSR